MAEGKSMMADHHSLQTEAHLIDGNCWHLFLVALLAGLLVLEEKYLSCQTIVFLLVPPVICFTELKMYVESLTLRMYCNVSSLRAD